MKRETSLQLVLATIAYHGNSCQRADASRVLRLVGLSDKYDPLGPPLSVLHSLLKLITVDGETIAFAHKRVRELVHPVTLAVVKALLDESEPTAFADEPSEVPANSGGESDEATQEATVPAEPA